MQPSWKGTDMLEKLDRKCISYLLKCAEAYDGFMGPTPATILVVDDDRDFRDFLALVLRAEGFVVELAEHGLAAMRALRALRYRRTLPHLILLDLTMPVMDGRAFRAVQRQDPAYCAIPVVVISGDADGREQAAALGVAGYLRRPASVEQLIAAVDRHARAPYH